MANCEYRIGPWEWDTSRKDGPHWRPPVGAVGAIDLANESSMLSPGADRSLGFFAVPVGSRLAKSTWPIIASGDLREVTTAKRMLDAWKSETGYRPSGDTLVDLIYDHLTNGSDPDWGTTAKPMMPTVRGNLDLHLGGHSLVKRDRFRFGQHGHTARVEALLQRDFRRAFEDVNQGKAPHDHNRRVLDYWIEKYKLDRRDAAQWRRLIPPDLRRHVPGPLKHATTLSDNFNRTNAATLGSNWTQTGEVSGIDSNNARCPDTGTATGVTGLAHYNASALSGDDHSSSISVLGVAGDAAYGPIARKPNSATVTYYHLRHNTLDGEVELAKWLAGSATILTNTSASPTTPFDLEVEIDGSSLSGIVDATSYGPITDTAITGNLYCGFRTYLDDGSAVRYDNWSCGDLAVSATQHNQGLLLLGVG